MRDCMGMRLESLVFFFIYAKITRVPLFYQMVVIKEDNLDLWEELGRGELGPVLRGTYRDPSGKELDVAVKTISIDSVKHGEQVE